MPIVECPACNSRDLYEIETVSYEESDSSNGVKELALFAHYGPSGEMGWMGDKYKRSALHASARVCGACGHTSLFVKDLDKLRKFGEQRLIRKLT